MIYIVGIDIASRNSGFTILDENREIVSQDDINLKSINKYKNDIDYFNNLKEQLNKRLIHFKRLIGNKCILVLEHNVRNKTLAKVLGMWISILSELEPVHIQFVEPSTWYSKLKLGSNKDKREVRKQKARDLFYQNNVDVYWEVSEDVADSYCIALSWWT